MHSDINLSTRQLRVGELLRRSLAEIFSKEAPLSFSMKNVSVTVTEVRMSPDLRHATIYVLPLSSQRVEKEQFLTALKEAKHEIRAVLTKKVHLKYSPELIFRFDESFDKFKQIDTLLKS
jgi:ribosome-binding factor A